LIRLTPTPWNWLTTLTRSVGRPRDLSISPRSPKSAQSAENQRITSFRLRPTMERSW
jgi:hypothetical protein